MAEVIALEITEGDNTEYGRVDEVVSTWTDVESGAELILAVFGGYEVTLEAGEYVRVYA